MARLIVYLLFGGMSIMFLYVGATQFFLQRRLMANAKPVEAEILKSEVDMSTSADTDRRVGRDNSTNSYSPEVLFRYEIGGVSYESDLLRPNIIVRGYASRDAAAEDLAPFPVGAKVTAYVDETKPDKAFLIAENGSGPIVFLILGLLLPPLSLLVARII
ncbi:MAG: DUF3592 domain-containing protein [Amphiplicatus sp.]|nr:DUF3592 domain-containing protein [Amphiplicatus sp.]